MLPYFREENCFSIWKIGAGHPSDGTILWYVVHLRKPTEHHLPDFICREFS